MATFDTSYSTSKVTPSETRCLPNSSFSPCCHCTSFSPPVPSILEENAKVSQVMLGSGLSFLWEKPVGI